MRNGRRALLVSGKPANGLRLRRAFPLSSASLNPALWALTDHGKGDPKLPSGTVRQPNPNWPSPGVWLGAIKPASLLKSVITVVKWFSVFTLGPESVTKVEAPVPANSAPLTVNVLPTVGAAGSAWPTVNPLVVLDAVITRVNPASE